MSNLILVFSFWGFFPKFTKTCVHFLPSTKQIAVLKLSSTVWISAPWAKRTEVSPLRHHPHQGVTSSYFLDLLLILLAFHFIAVSSLCQLNNRFTHRSNISGTLILSTYYLGVKEKVGCLIGVDHWQWQMHRSRNRKSLCCQHQWQCRDCMWI